MLTKTKVLVIIDANRSALKDKHLIRDKVTTTL